MVAKAKAKTTRVKTTGVQTVDDYLAAAPADKRAALNKLRRTIRAAAPDAVESVSYGIVGYKQNGQRLIYFGYWKDHMSLYGMGDRALKAHAKELKPFVQSKGTIQFTTERPLPVRLVARLVKERLAEIQTKGYR
jgi:uncharacterized protein YdhG (YjbR/CyaY superfamily)